jgi:hypothetical protein
MKIIRARLKPYGVVTEFISVSGRIKGLLDKNKGDEFHFVIDEDGVKTVKEFGPENINPELVDQSIKICATSKSREDLWSTATANRLSILNKTGQAD